MDPLHWDREAARWIVEHRVGLFDPVAVGLSRAGSASRVWLVLALLLAVSRRRPVLFAAVAAAAALSGLLTRILKAAVARPRPDWPALLPQPANGAFPSGHACSSFACATVIGSLVPAWRWPAYGLAALIASSRVWVGAHYPLDVLGGALLGIGIGLAIVALSRAAAPSSTAPGESST